MVTLPKEFVAVQYPGYFWNILDEKLYSVKVTGMLKPLTFGFAGSSQSGRWLQDKSIRGYWVSIKGRKHFLEISGLKKLTPKRSVFPVYTQLELI